MPNGDHLVKMANNPENYKKETALIFLPNIPVFNDFLR